LKNQNLEEIRRKFKVLNYEQLGRIDLRHISEEELWAEVEPQLKKHVSDVSSINKHFLHDKENLFKLWYIF
jgi:hypothetical protein